MLQVVKEQADDYDSFVNEVLDRVREKAGGKYSVRLYKVIKNNSLELDSLILLKEGKNFTPNIYLLPYYQSYLEGTPVQEIADRLCGIYESCTVPMIKENFTYSFEEMKPFIIYRLVSFERNRKLLETIPYVRFLDLAVTFHCLVRNDEDGIGTIRITNDHVSMWQTSSGEIQALAKENTCRWFGCTIRRMDEIIKGMLSEADFDRQEGGYLNDQLFPEDIPTALNCNMYVLSNQKGINGASCLLYEGVLKKFAEEIRSDLYILPSSIHEVILIPYDKSMDKATLTEMVIMSTVPR
jgi:hypothetical protein